jgi:4-hydroxy 2-oxovalerate aldolase
MSVLNVKDVAVAGFDEFREHYNETYADSSLPTVNPEGNSDKLNKEILDMFKDFKKTVGDSMNIEFVTESIFDV